MLILKMLSLISALRLFIQKISYAKENLDIALREDGPSSYQDVARADYDAVVWAGSLYLIGAVRAELRG